MHLHVYLGCLPGGSCHLVSDHQLDPCDLAIGGGAVNVRRVFSRNGKGIRKGVEGALYYVVAQKLGSVLTYTTTVLWQAGVERFPGRPHDRGPSRRSIPRGRGPACHAPSISLCAIIA